MAKTNPQVSLPVMKVTSQIPNSDDRPPAHQNVFPMHFKEQSRWSQGQDQLLAGSDSSRAKSDSPSQVELPRFKFVKPTFKAAFAERLSNPTKKRKRTPSEMRPAKTQRTEESPSFPSKTPRLTMARPVKNADDVHRDIWRNILSYCEPKFLMRAKTISSMFHELLSEQTIWRESRELHLDGSPDCPASLTEQQYIDLLVGKGCQSSGCSRRDTATVTWAFKVRLCVDCLHKRTISVGDLPAERQHRIPTHERLPESLWNALPMIATRGVRYGETRPPILEERRWRYTNGCLRCLRSDLDKLEAQWHEFQQSEPTDEATRTWWLSKQDATMEEVNVLYNIEYWSRQRHCQTYETSSDFRRQKVRFFVAQAAKLDPPICETALNCMAPYQKALKSDSPPTLRSWEVLKKKILPYQHIAKRLTDEFAASLRTQSDTYERRTWRKLQDHRYRLSLMGGELQPEQQFVIRLGREQFTKCTEEGVCDEDILLTCLNRTFDAYQQLTDRPTGLNYDGSHSLYALSMDDARMIVEEVVEREIPPKSTRGVTVHKSFRCPGCTRKDYIRNYTFQDCMQHILFAHSCTVGEGKEYWRYAVKYCESIGAMYTHGGVRNFHYYQFPWFTSPWTKSLPLLPSYVDPFTAPSWHPHANIRFAKQSRSTPTDSIFVGRRVTFDPTKSEFEASFVHAAETIKGVRLQKRSMVRIALQYSLDVCEAAGTTIPTVDEFVSAIPTFQEANQALDFKFKCGSCVTDETENASARHVKYEVPMSWLHKHWHKKHHPEGVDWTKYMMHLPSDEELTTEILEIDAQLEQHKAEVAAKTSSSVNPRKKPNPKANAVLNTKLVMEAVDVLFSKL